MGASVQAQVQRGGYPNAKEGPTLLGTLSLLEPQFRWTRKNFFGYVTEFLTLGASATVTNSVTIQGDSDFIITYATAIVTDSANTTQVSFPPQLVQLTDAAAGVNFFLLPEHFLNVYGDAQNPGIFSDPIVMRAATTLQVQHQNLEAVARNVRCAFNGMRSYPGTDTRDPRWQTR
jgi:hypothetical protein